MNNQSILIAENGVDMFDKNIPLENVLPPEEEQHNSFPVVDLPELPAAQPTEYYSQQTQPPVKSEAGVLAEKAFISFGTLALCIIVIFICYFLLKKKNEYNEQDIYTYNEPSSVNRSVVNENTNKTENRPKSKLNTPSSIHKCILSFLEITKEN